jgi:signal transduction histidine kinase
MAVARTGQKPTFLWQALLIMLPVVVLAVVGFFSLRQDRLLASYAAAERAQAVVDELAPKLWATLTATNQIDHLKTPIFETDATGRLSFPPPYEEVPVPGAFDLTKLNELQAELWLRIQAVETGSGEAAGLGTAGPDGTGRPRAARSGSELEQVYRDFLGSKPAAEFVAAGLYGLGLQLSKIGQVPEALALFARLGQDYPEARGESGLPLKPLAELKSLELQSPAQAVTTGNRPAGLGSFCSNAVYYPTPVTPDLLSRAAEFGGEVGARQTVENWQRIWQEHEAGREVFAAAHGNLAGPALLLTSNDSRSLPGSSRVSWFRYEEQDWLAIGFEEGLPGHWYICRSEADVGRLLGGELAGSKHIPDYLGIALEVNGRRVARYLTDLRVWHKVHYMSKGGGHDEREFGNAVATNVLASASLAPGSGMTLRAYLTSPATLYERESARTFWFGTLIVVSAGAALVGLAAAWRAFQRQLLLGEMKSNFVSSVSHELRAPIASVRLLAESLERGKVPQAPRQQEYFRFIVQECRRLSSLVENVLDFSRIEQGRKEYEFEPTDVAALAETTIKVMETYAAERQVVLQFNNLPTRQSKLEPKVDGKALQQALVNLIDNAVKHSPKGGTVTVGLEDGAGAGHVRLWVEDQGPGIPAAEHERIFERFYRRGSELRRETQGVGIGLSIVKHIVEAHGGRVVVRSEAGQGSRFTIEVPVNRGEAESWSL